jgi:type I restriction enzyme R subunit
MDVRDFCPTFLNKKTLLNVLLRFSVFNSNDELLIMRPYQIAAAERIYLQTLNAVRENKFSSDNAGGYI